MSIEKMGNSVPEPEAPKTETAPVPEKEELQNQVEELSALDSKTEPKLTGPKYAQRRLLRSLTVASIFIGGVFGEGADARRVHPMGRIELQSERAEEIKQELEELEELDKTEEERAEREEYLRSTLDVVNMYNPAKRWDQILESMGVGLSRGKIREEGPNIYVEILHNGESVGEVESDRMSGWSGDGEDFKEDVRMMLTEKGVQIPPPRDERFYAYLITETNRSDLSLKDISEEDPSEAEAFRIYKTVSVDQDTEPIGVIRSAGDKFTSEEFKVRVRQLLEAAGETVEVQKETMEGYSFTANFDPTALGRFSSLGGFWEGNKFYFPREPVSEPVTEPITEEDGIVLEGREVVDDSTEHLIFKAHPDGKRVTIMTENTDGTTDLLIYPRADGQGGIDHWQW